MNRNPKIVALVLASLSSCTPASGQNTRESANVAPMAIISELLERVPSGIKNGKRCRAAQQALNETLQLDEKLFLDIYNQVQTPKEKLSLFKDIVEKLITLEKGEERQVSISEETFFEESEKYLEKMKELIPPLQSTGGFWGKIGAENGDACRQSRGGLSNSEYRSMAGQYSLEILQSDVLLEMYEALGRLQTEEGYQLQTRIDNAIHRAEEVILTKSNENCTRILGCFREIQRSFGRGVGVDIDQ